MTRIIAGLAKGRRLVVPSAGTRPTSDRAREGLFNTLAATVDLDGAHVLDLYAGTGALGLEALSRGAASAVLVESDAKAAATLRRNVDTVGLPGARVVHAPVRRYLDSAPDAPADLVLADPPYALGPDELTPVIAAVLASALAPDGLVVVETSARTDLSELAIPDLTWTARKRYGEALLWYGHAR